MYLTPEQLADANLSQELAQVCTPFGQPSISATLMEATLRGTDRTGSLPQDLANADAALRMIEAAILTASGMIDGYLRSRKPPYVVPLQSVPENVTLWARWITRYLLHKDLVGGTDQQHPIVAQYREAIRFLQAVAEGKFSLGSDDPLPPAAIAVLPQVDAAERTFTRESLRDFGT